MEINKALFSEQPTSIHPEILNREMTIHFGIAIANEVQGKNIELRSFSDCLLQILQILELL